MGMILETAKAGSLGVKKGKGRKQRETVNNLLHQVVHEQNYTSLSS